jgi:hypothetical protein
MFRGSPTRFEDLQAFPAFVGAPVAAVRADEHANAGAGSLHRSVCVAQTARLAIEGVPTDVPEAMAGVGIRELECGFGFTHFRDTILMQPRCLVGRGEYGALRRRASAGSGKSG